MIFAPTIILPILKHNQGLVNQEIQVKYMGILELWHIDTFEGGSRSKINFLENQALKFEKKNTGTFIMCYQMSVEQAKLNLSNGLKPDLVSFGIGMGADLIQSLIPLNSTYNIRDDLINGGMNSGILYALPYMLGGYVLVNENDLQLKNQITQLLGYGGASYNSAIISLALNNIKADNLFSDSYNIDSFDAYDKYLSKKFDILLGTQRDLYRIQNRIDKGNMNARNFEYMTGFSDLIQYIGICSLDAIKQEICEKFVEQLFSNDAQSQLVDYNMFSTTGQRLYSSSEFANLEVSLSKPLKTLSVFLTQQKIDEIKQIATNIVKGNANIDDLTKYLV